MDKLILIFK